MAKEFAHHVAYYSYSTLKLRHRLNVEKFLFYDLGREHRPHNRNVFSLLNDVCVWPAPQWADGVVAVCTLPVPADEG